MWQRWNGTSHVFEKSDDNGSSWAPLPLSAATITEGILASARLPSNVAFKDAANVFTGHQTLSGAGLIFAGSIGLLGPSMFLNANTLMIRGGTLGFGIQNQAGTLHLLSLGDTGNFSVVGSITGSSLVSSGTGNADVVLVNSTGTPEYKRWRIAVASDTLYIQRLNDAGSVVNATPLQFSYNGIATFLTTIVTGGDVLPSIDGSGGVGTAAKRWNVVYATTGTIQTSDIRLKSNVQRTVHGRDFLMKLKPIDYDWTDKPEIGRQHGFAAQDVADAMSDFGGLDRNEIGVPTGLNYSQFIAPLVAGWQEHEERLAKLENR